MGPPLRIYSLMNFLLYFFLIVPPLNLDWNKPYDKGQIESKLKDYKYYSGNISKGPLVYVGTKNFLGMENELQLFFAKSKIRKAILILGPKGITTENCVGKFNKHIANLIEKYGRPTYQKTENSFLKNELVYTSECHLYYLGMRKRTLFWESKNFKIKSYMVGDEEGFYIETLYLNKKSLKNIFYENKKNIYKKISKEI